MRALRTTLVVVALAVLIFVGGVAAGVALQRAGSSGGARAQGDLVRQILTDLQRNYYKPVDLAKLGHTGITALLASLHDPYTVYFTPQEARQFSQELSGTYSGIGTAVVLEEGPVDSDQGLPRLAGVSRRHRPRRGHRHREWRADRRPAREHLRG